MKPSLFLHGLLPVVLTSMLSTGAFAASATWNVNAAGNWTTPGNWTAGGPPNGAAETASLTFNISSNRTITLDAPQTISTLTIGDPTSSYFAYTLSGASALTISGGSILKSTSTANTAKDKIAVPITLTADLIIDQKAAGGVLEFSGAIGKDSTNRNVKIYGNGSNTMTSGVVLFSTANNYGGLTTIGVGGTGSTNGSGGVLRISNGGALGSGEVYLDTNTTTCSRLELAGGITVTNNITTFKGNDTNVDIPRLASFSGANEWAGTISNFSTNGTNYPIHSLGTATGDFFTISGAITYGRSDSRNLRFGGAGNGKVTGKITESSTGSLPVIKDSAGTWTFSNDNTYKGTTTVNAGTLLVNGAHTGGALYTVKALATLGGSGSIASSVTVEATGKLAPGSTVGSVGTLTTGALNLAGSTYNVEISSGTADKLVVNGDLDISAAILSVTEISLPTLTPYVIATYSGALTGSFSSVPAGYEVDTISTPGSVLLALVGARTTVAWNTDSDGDWTTGGNWTLGGPPNGVDVMANLNFNLTADRIITLDVPQTVGILNISDATAGYFAYQINGSGKLIFNRSGGAQINKTQDFTKMTVTGAAPNGLNPNTAHDVIGVPIELQSDVTIRSNALNGILEFSGEISNNGSSKNVIVRGPSLSGTETEDQGGKALVVFSTANSYNGTTTIDNGGRLRITDGQALGTGVIANIAGSTTTRTLSSLELAGDITVNNDVTQLAGTDVGIDTIARIQSLSGHNTFAGDMLGITTGGSSYPIHSVGTAPGDFFTFSGNIINNRNQAGNNRYLRFGGAGDGEVTGNIIETNTSEWAVAKDNAGTWTLSGTNSYQSTTTVNAGTLIINGTQTGSGNYTVVAGATLEIGPNGWLSNPAVLVDVNLNSTLSGSGLIEGSVVVNGTLAPGGIGSVGTLTTGTVDLAGIYNIDIDDGDADRLDVLGDLDIDGASLSVTEISPATVSPYVIATYTGTLTGTFLSVPAGYEVDTISSPGEVLLVLVPTTFSWKTDNDGDWTTIGNWTFGGPPNGADVMANLNFNLTADRTITLDVPQTVGILNVSDATAGYFAYRIDGSGKLILNKTGGAQINKTHDFTKMTVTGLPPNGLNPNTAHDVIAVPIELQSDVSIRSNALNGILEFSGEIGNNGSNKNVVVRGPDLSNTESDEQGGKALVVFSTANSYGGGTTLTNGGRLRITHGQALGTGNIDNITGGANVRTISSLELAGGITVNNDVTTIAGTDSGIDTVARIASVSGHNTFAGNMEGIAPGGSSYPIHSVGTAPGDFFTFSGNIINNRNQPGNNRYLRFGGAGDGEVTGNIIETNTSEWAVAKDNAGTWTLSGGNTYKSTTTVNEGTLLVNGTHSGGALYTVNANATLGGVGSIASSVTVEATGKLAPGSTVGTVGTLTFGTVLLPTAEVNFAGGTYNVEISGSTADKLVVYGNLDISAASLTITEISPASETGYLIATYTGTLSGSFLSVPAGYEVDTDTPNEVWLVKSEDSGTAYAMWMDSFPTLTEEADREPGADPDGDGMANGIEYVLGGDPTQSSVDLLPKITVTGSDIIFTFHRSDVSKDGVTGVYVQYGTDLSGWTDLLVPEDAGVYGLVTVGETGDISVTIPKDGDGKKFVRLKAAVEKLAVE